MSYLKADCVSNAYKELRISGLTVSPSAEHDGIALRKLEGIANQYFRRNICVGYNFEDTPDINSTAGIPVEFQAAFEENLAVELFSIFGKGASPDPSLIRRAAGKYSYLSGATAIVPRVRASGRMPIGSGNERYNSHNRFYKTAATAPLGCATNKMIIGDIRDFVEHFDSYLIDAEVISAYTIEANTGLTVTLDAISVSETDITYRVEAVGGSTNNPDGLSQIKIVVTTDDGRVSTRLISFELTEVDIG